MRQFIKILKKFVRFVTLISADIFSYYLSLYFAVKLRNLLVSNVELVPLNTLFRFRAFAGYWVFPLIMLVIFWLYDLYSRRKPFWYETEMYVKSLIVSGFITFAFVGFAKDGYNISRLVVALQVLIGFMVFPLVRWLAKIVMYKLLIWRERALLFSKCDVDTSRIVGLSDDPYLGYEFTSVCLSDKSSIDLGRKLTEWNISVLVVVLDSISDKRILQFINRVYKYVDNILIIPDATEFSMMGSSVYHIFNERLFVLETPNTLKSLENIIIKRLFDFFVGWFCLIVGLPIIIFLSLMILVIDRSYPFFVHTRYNKDGGTFKVIKFQTMQTRVSKDKEYEKRLLKKYFKTNPQAKKDWIKYKKIKDSDDPRVSKFGRVLRKTSLDELPQIFNVILGQMSLVGPRPYLLREREDIGDFFDVVLSVKPGITGLWQISGRSDVSFAERLRLDEWYIRNWTVWLDIVIFVKTAQRVLLRSDGSY